MARPAKFINFIWKRMYVVLIFLVLGVSTSGFYAFIYAKPVYESSTSIYVINDSSNKDSQKVGFTYEDLLAGQLLVKNYKELIKSRVVTKEVISELGLKGVDPDKLAAKVSIDLKSDSNILNIAVIDGNPVMAQKIADKMSQVFIDKAIEIMKVRNISMIDSAELPERPIAPRKSLIVLIGTVVGAFIGLFILILLAYLDDQIRTPEDIEDTLDLPTMGIIPELSLK